MVQNVAYPLALLRCSTSVCSCRTSRPRSPNCRSRVKGAAACVRASARVKCEATPVVGSASGSTHPPPPFTAPTARPLLGANTLTKRGLAVVVRQERRAPYGRMLRPQLPPASSRRRSAIATCPVARITRGEARRPALDHAACGVRDCESRDFAQPRAPLVVLRVDSGMARRTATTRTAVKRRAATSGRTDRSGRVARIRSVLQLADCISGSVGSPRLLRPLQKLE